ncbi:MAG: hypothetical protein V4560_17415 [Bacteroidota bacterium]
MKNILIICTYIIISSCNVTKEFTSSGYYIYVKPTDILFHKESRRGGYSITYACHCYARNNNMEFTHADTSESFFRKNLPQKTISMKEFAQIANNERAKFKNLELWRTKTYIIEKIGTNNYKYYKVQFYTIEGDD